MSRIIASSTFLIILTLLLNFIGCDGSNVVFDPHAPVFGDFVTPIRGSTDQPTEVTFQWTCSDPDGDSLTYDLYLGTGNRTDLYANNITDTFYTVGGLRRSEKYFWYVVAKVDGSYAARTFSRWFKTTTMYMYPLKVGNSWTYDGYSVLTDCVNGGSGYYPNDSVSRRATVAVVDNTLLFEGYNVFKIAEYDGVFLGERPAISYYSNRPDGLYYLDGIGVVTPKQSTEMLPVAFNGYRFESIQALTNALIGSLSQRPEYGQRSSQEPYPLLSLKYPVQIGDQWTFRSAGNPWRIDKRINGIISVKTESGEFDCWEVEWLYQFDENEEWQSQISIVDYISDIGLIKRMIRIEGIVFYDQHSPTPIDTCDYNETWELTSSNVK